MFERLKARFRHTEPTGPQRPVREFTPEERPITIDGVSVEEGGWRIDCDGKRTVQLFEVELADVDQAMLTYRAKLKTRELAGKAYLEMWCGVPGRGEFFSRGLRNKVGGTTDWGTYQTQFFLRKGQHANLARLNIVVKGSFGTIWVKNVGLDQTPLR